jgi:hypothetical protein
MLDTTAKPDQLARLVQNHDGNERRCREAYATATLVGDAVRDAVRKHTGKEMPLAFVTSEQASEGFLTSTFSFNLPGNCACHSLVRTLDRLIIFCSRGWAWSTSLTRKRVATCPFNQRRIVRTRGQCRPRSALR